MMMPGAPARWQALTLTQPMASAVAIDHPRRKDVENRSTAIGRTIWPRWVGLHAGKGWVPSYAETCEAIIPADDARPLLGYTWDDVPQGVMLGAMLIDWCLPYGRPVQGLPFMAGIAAAATMKSSPWAGGPWCLHVREVRRLERPVPCRGMLGLWPVPEPVADQLAGLFR